MVLPKGLDHNTLKMVWEKLVEFNEPFTTEQMASMIVISHVSIRKYLEFLTSMQILKLDLHHLEQLVARYININVLINRRI